MVSVIEGLLIEYDFLFLGVFCKCVYCRYWFKILFIEYCLLNIYNFNLDVIVSEVEGL